MATKTTKQTTQSTASGIDQTDQTEQDERVTALEGELATARQDHLRAIADYQNLERRIEETQRRLARLASIDLVAKIVEPMDHLRMTISHQQDETAKRALEMILKQFEDALQQEGVQSIEPVEGDEFSVELMEVSETQEVEDQDQDERIIQTVRIGYMIEIEGKPFLIRPASVIVGKYKSE